MTTLPTAPHPTSVFASEDWPTYELELVFTGRLVGGIPSDPQLVEGWLKSKFGVTDAEQLREWTVRTLAEVHGLEPSEAEDATVLKAVEEQAIEKHAQVFKRTPEGDPYLEGRQIKAMLKEATNIAYPRGEHKWGSYANAKGSRVGGKAPVDFLAERVWVPEQPYALRCHADFPESAFDLAIGHIKDFREPSGKRSTIGYFEYLTQPTLRFEAQVLDNFLTSEQWARIMVTAERSGLGARRSQGAGQFVVTRWEKA